MLKQRNYKVVSLFSGCGGLDLGFKQAGFKIIWANDIDSHAVETYKHNIGDIIEGDIRQISNDDIPECDVLTAGFPCQPFSSAGNRRGVEDDRGTLFEECIRVIAAKKPYAVVFENVRGILSIKNKDGSYLIDTIVNKLESLDPGYDVYYKLLKASDYGVPQQRYRVFIIGFRKDLNAIYEFPEPTHAPTDPSLTVGSIINVPEYTPNQNEVWDLSPQTKKLVPYIKEGGSWKDIPYDVLPPRFKHIRDNIRKYKSPNFYRRYARNEINGTITAAATPENCGIIHPIENRRYSVREIARIQSFPDDFVFVGDSIQAKYRIIGNAVPPKLAKVIAESIKETLDIVLTPEYKNSNIKMPVKGQLSLII